jgi:hypothetical protein
MELASLNPLSTLKLAAEELMKSTGLFTLLIKMRA